LTRAHRAEEGDAAEALVWLHSVLVVNGAADVRWFSRDKSVQQADGASLPSLTPAVARSMTAIAIDSAIRPSGIAESAFP
jgi:hypothetical protein